MNHYLKVIYFFIFWRTLLSFSLAQNVGNKTKNEQRITNLLMKTQCNNTSPCEKGKLCKPFRKFFSGKGDEQLFDRCSSNATNEIGRCVTIPKSCKHTNSSQKVCGCDNKTYDSRCLARKAQVLIKDNVSCESLCNSNENCSESEFCYLSNKGKGRCIDKPVICTMELAPVCAQGKTYDNKCAAHAAGKNIDARFACEDVCSTNKDCEDTEFCYLSNKGKGQCIDKPVLCTMEMAPVCAQGKTYDNKCAAHAAGMNIDARFACEDVCSTNKDCEDTEFCYRKSLGQGRCVEKPDKDGINEVDVKDDDSNHENIDVDDDDIDYFSIHDKEDCESSSDCTEDNAFCWIRNGKIFKCITKPQICTADYNPICGTDKQTYPNECSAMSVGVNMLSKGECDNRENKLTVKKACTSNEDCKDVEFCLIKYINDGLPDSKRSTSDSMIEYIGCMVRPEICTAIYNPVCGEDGVTHSSVCSANARGINPKYNGECLTRENEQKNEICKSNEDCKPMEFCLVDYLESSQKRETGRRGCVVRPEICLLEYKPVCGNDGITYSSKCVAHVNGINAISTGEC